jgi:hypothetical protein
VSRPPWVVGGRWRPGVTLGVVVVTLVLAALVVLLTDAVLDRLIVAIAAPEPARVAVAVTTGEAVVVRTTVDDRRRSYLVPAQTTVVLPPGDHGRIEVLDEACHPLGVVDQGDTVVWQLVVVAPGAVTSDTPVGTPPPLPEAEPTTACP